MCTLKKCYYVLFHTNPKNLSFRIYTRVFQRGGELHPWGDLSKLGGAKISKGAKGGANLKFFAMNLYFIFWSCR